MTITSMFPRGSRNIGGLSVRVCLFLLCLAVAFSALISSDATAFFGSESDEAPYVAKVGDKVITLDEYIEAINFLHKSSRVGERIKLGEPNYGGFGKEDYMAFLQELIDRKLMMIEAENMGLDQDADFVAEAESFELNLKLEKLRAEMILKDITVQEDDIKKEYIARVRANTAKEAESNPRLKDTDTDEDILKRMGHKDRASVVDTLKRPLIKAREDAYFKSLRDAAVEAGSIEVNEELLKTLSASTPGLRGKTVGNVSGEAINGLEFVKEIGQGVVSEEARRAAIDRLILYKLLDIEAKRRNYGSLPDVKKRLAKYKEERLVNLFKNKVVGPLVIVNDDELKARYDRDIESFKVQDSVHLRQISVHSKAEADDVMRELSKGAEFSFLARRFSKDEMSRAAGGDIGWVSIDSMPSEGKDALKNAKEGDVLGVFQEKYLFYILQYLGTKKGTYKPFESVKSAIYKKVGAEKYDAIVKKYTERLREVVPVELNQEELKKAGVN